jgi:hypothetical protein
MESINILQEECDENKSMEEEVYEEEKEEDMTQPKFGDVLEPLDDDNIQTENSIAIYENSYTSCEGIQNHENPSYYYVPLLASNGTSEIIDDRECRLDMLYDTALDDGPTLIDNPPYLHEDRNDILVIHDDVIHGSPILFLKSPTYTIEEKYAYVEKYLCGLQISYEKSYCNHDAMIKNDISNYFERGKHDTECLNKSNDPPYVPKISKLHDSNISTITFSSNNCNYYERGGDKYPLYASTNDMMCSPNDNIQCDTHKCRGSLKSSMGSLSEFIVRLKESKQEY